MKENYFYFSKNRKTLKTTTFSNVFAAAGVFDLPRREMLFGRCRLGDFLSFGRFLKKKKEKEKKGLRR
jgi:hypothetical protein